MDDHTLLRDAGFSCGLPTCACAGKIATTLTEEQRARLQALVHEGYSEERERFFIESLDRRQRHFVKIIDESMIGSSVVPLFPKTSRVQEIASDDDDAMSPEQIALRNRAQGITETRIA